MGLGIDFALICLQWTSEEAGCFGHVFIRNGLCPFEYDIRFNTNEFVVQEEHVMSCGAKYFTELIGCFLSVPKSSQLAL